MSVSHVTCGNVRLVFIVSYVVAIGIVMVVVNCVFVGISSGGCDVWLKILSFLWSFAEIIVG